MAGESPTDALSSAELPRSRRVLAKAKDSLPPPHRPWRSLGSSLRLSDQEHRGGTADRVPIIDRLAALRSITHSPRPTDRLLLFPSANDPEWPTDPSILDRRTHARWEKADLKPFGFHEGRHTCASMPLSLA